MNKMIDVQPNGNWTCCGVSPGAIDSRIYGALCKLKDYESTNLSPGDVEMVKKMYDDLVHRYDKLLEQYDELKKGVEMRE